MTPQELKNSILQLAIQGRLVEQRPEEGTAAELYNKLKKYHVSLKKSKDELDYSSMDLDLPESWKMVELNYLFKFVDYRGMTPSKISEGIFLITASNIKMGYMDYSRKEYISYEEYENRKSRGITQKGDLLFTTEAPMGNVALCDLNVCSCGQRIITFQYYEENTVIPSLFMYFILSPQFQKQLLNNCTGTTAKGIKADKLKHFLIPLPPLSEQKRIVAKIEELLPLIDRYGAAWSRLEEFNKRFPDDMQKSILQMAIQGKLVEQRPEEGTGEELYKQIQKELLPLIKLKKFKGKHFSDLSESELPFDIPESWKWVRLGDIISIESGKNLTSSQMVEGMVPVYGGNGITGYHNESLVHKETIVIGRVGFYCGSVHVTEPEAWITDNAFITTYPEKSINRDYLVYVLRQMNLGKDNNATAQPVVSGKKIYPLAFPLPPLAEQKRIVAKIEELLPLCERLK